MLLASHANEDYLKIEKSAPSLRNGRRYKVRLVDNRLGTLCSVEEYKDYPGKQFLH